MQGAAVGGGLGVAMMADFRVVCETTRLTANFVKLGFTPALGSLILYLERLARRSHTLCFIPATDRRQNRSRLGCGGYFAGIHEVREKAIELAREIAVNDRLR